MFINISGLVKKIPIFCYLLQISVSVTYLSISRSLYFPLCLSVRTVYHYNSRAASHTDNMNIWSPSPAFLGINFPGFSRVSAFEDFSPV